MKNDAGNSISQAVHARLRLRHLCATFARRGLLNPRPASYPRLAFLPSSGFSRLSRGFLTPPGLLHPARQRRSERTEPAIARCRLAAQRSNSAKSSPWPQLDYSALSSFNYLGAGMKNRRHSCGGRVSIFDGRVTSCFCTSSIDCQPLRTVRRGKRGPQKVPTKKLISLRLSPDVIDHFKSTGRGWQTRIDGALREAIRKRAQALADSGIASI